MVQGPLQGIRVVDMADESAVFGSRILADLGAEVLRIDSAIDTVRWRSPFLYGKPGPENTFYHFYHNLNKRSVRIDTGDEEGLERLRTLLKAADVLVETERPALWRRDASPSPTSSDSTRGSSWSPLLPSDSRASGVLARGPT